MKELKQQCFLWSVWLTWIGLPILALGMGIYRGWWAGVVVLLVGVFGQAYYVRVFPKISQAMGYGTVEDTPVQLPVQQKTAAHVTLYTANVCPFCPIVKRRLLELQRTAGFELSEVDVTFQPGLVKEKGFQSVPVIELDGRFWVGNATSAQLAAFITQQA
jgi:glutaredoxin